jgi:hypothetical protein
LFEFAVGAGEVGGLFRRQIAGCEVGDESFEDAFFAAVAQGAALFADCGVECVAELHGGFLDSKSSPHVGVPTWGTRNVGLTARPTRYSAKRQAEMKRFARSTLSRVSWS